jgi:hypothetical protein
MAKGQKKILIKNSYRNSSTVKFLGGIEYFFNNTRRKEEEEEEVVVIFFLN